MIAAQLANKCPECGSMNLGSAEVTLAAAKNKPDQQIAFSSTWNRQNFVTELELFTKFRQESPRALAVGVVKNSTHLVSLVSFRPI